MDNVKSALHYEMSQSAYACQDHGDEQVSTTRIIIVLRQLQQRVKAFVPAMFLLAQFAKLELNNIGSFLQEPFRGRATFRSAYQSLNCRKTSHRIVSKEKQVLSWRRDSHGFRMLIEEHPSRKSVAPVNLD